MTGSGRDEDDVSLEPNTLLGMGDDYDVEMDSHTENTNDPMEYLDEGTECVCRSRGLLREIMYRCV